MHIPGRTNDSFYDYLLRYSELLFTELIFKYESLSMLKEMALVIWAVPVAWSELESLLHLTLENI